MAYGPGTAVYSQMTGYVLGLITGGLLTGLLAAARRHMFAPARVRVLERELAVSRAAHLKALRDRDEAQECSEAWQAMLVRHLMDPV